MSKVSLTPFSEQIWRLKYKGENEDSIEDTWRRVAQSVASVETQHKAKWTNTFYKELSSLRFLPGGRILAGAGSGTKATLYNCFVMGPLEDSMDGIFQSLKESALTLQQGGGIGCDFSNLRPRESSAKTAGTKASGPVSFMQIWNAMSEEVLSTSKRRGAMMANLRVDHPDVMDFITAKAESGKLSHFNLSLLISDDFMSAVRADAHWPLKFPLDRLSEADRKGKMIVKSSWSGESQPIDCAIFSEVPAKEIWTTIIENNHQAAEPGVVFIDRVNRENNLWYAENISATNPCGEVPLPAHGACDLGSINLTQFVKWPFSEEASFDFEKLEQTVQVGVRFLDNVVDLSPYPLIEQNDWAQKTRRLGLGITGLGDTLWMLGLDYAHQEGSVWAGEVMELIRDKAYKASIELSTERGSFPLFDAEKYLKAPFVKNLPGDIQSDIQSKGLRNSHLLSIAPAGSISLVANNVSGGIEPIFAKKYKRKVHLGDNKWEEIQVEDFAFSIWKQKGEDEDHLKMLKTATQIKPEGHILMQAAVQKFVDNAISKTINVPESTSKKELQNIYNLAFDQGLKGCTVYRPNAITGEILSE